MSEQILSISYYKKYLGLSKKKWVIFGDRKEKWGITMRTQYKYRDDPNLGGGLWLESTREKTIYSWTGEKEDTTANSLLRNHKEQARRDGVLREE